MPEETDFQWQSTSRQPWHGRWAEDRFDIEPIADEEVFPVCSPDFAERLPSTISAVDLASQPLLHLVDVGREWPDWRAFLANFRIKEPAPIEGLMFSSYQVCLDVAEAGDGVALGWGRTVKDRLLAGRLVRLSNMSITLQDHINVYLPKRVPHNLFVERFLTLLNRRL